MTLKKHSGFTLIELSIVLVIVALIIGGVLIGRDLIRVTEMRALASQVEQIETAITTFKGKYNCIVGDCPNATRFFSSVSNGNGNGIVCTTYANGCNAAGTNATLSFFGNAPGAFYEVSSVFDHLAAAGLINLQPYDETAVASNSAGVGFPEMKFQGTGIQAATAYGSKGGLVLHYLKSYLHITEGHKLTLGGCGGGGGANMGFYCGMKGAEAMQYDTKFDDGLPLTGRISITGTVYVYRVPGDANNEVGNHCTTSASASVNEYRTIETGNGLNRRCNLSINMPF